MAFESMEEWLKCSRDKNVSAAEAVILEDMSDRGVSREETWARMSAMWNTMCSSEQDYDRSLRSHSGLVGGAAGQMEDYLKTGHTLCGNTMGKVIMRALRLGESNACMKRIVAAPTAGACGVLPAVLVTAAEQEGFSDEQMTEALFVAAGIGQIIAARACIAGAMGGCQAEIGSASSMAAGALVCLKDGTPEQMADASAIALKNLLGLVCDPVAGLVEVPCVKRNVIGAVNAMAAADMALAGIRSAIPADQVFDAMKEVGDLMSSTLRETAEGGLAATAAGQAVSKRLKGEQTAKSPGA